MDSEMSKSLRPAETQKPPPSSGPPGPGFDGDGLGKGLGLLLYAVTQRDGGKAVLEAFAPCQAFGCVGPTLVQMPSTTFAGVLFWVLVMFSTTVALAWYLWSRWK